MPSSGTSVVVWALVFFWSSLILGLLGISHLAEARIAGIVIQTRTSPRSAAPHSVVGTFLYACRRSL